MTAATAGTSWTLPVAAQASDDVSVTRVDFFIGSVLAATRHSPPYRVDLPVPDTGVTSLTLTAVAWDSVGQSATSEAVTVAVEPNEPPIVTILVPQDGDRVIAGDTVRVTVGATDDVGLLQVRYLVNGELVATDCCEPFELTVQVEPGATEVRLAAAAVDSSGQVSTSPEVVLAVDPDQPPAVAILEPPAGARFFAGQTVRVLVDATDDLGVAQVRCLLDGALVGLAFAEPFEMTFQLDPWAAGEARLTAEAVDSGGQTSTSDEVVLTVDPAQDTTAVGRVLDDGAPVAGAEVECRESFARTGALGAFSIPGLSVTEGPVSCSAKITTAAGELRRAVSGPRAPVPEGITDMGDLLPAPFLRR